MAAWRRGCVALTVIRHECCCSKQQHVHRPLLLAARGRGSAGALLDPYQAYRRQSRSRSAHATADKKRGWDGVGWSGMGCDGDHDIFAVALMRTWVSKVSALCRYSASSAVQAVQTVQTTLKLTPNLMKQILLYDPRFTNNAYW